MVHSAKLILIDEMRLKHCLQNEWCRQANRVINNKEEEKMKKTLKVSQVKTNARLKNNLLCVSGEPKGTQVQRI